jgi:hypothetical protein
MKKNIIHHRRRADTIMHERAASGGAAVEAVEEAEARGRQWSLQGSIRAALDPAESSKRHAPVADPG